MDINKIIELIRESKKSKKSKKCPPGYKWNKKNKYCVPKKSSKGRVYIGWGRGRDESELDQRDLRYYLRTMAYTHSADGHMGWGQKGKLTRYKTKRRQRARKQAIAGGNTSECGVGRGAGKRWQRRKEVEGLQMR